MKKIIIITLSIFMAVTCSRPVHAQFIQSPSVIPMKYTDHQWMPSISLPMVDIYPVNPGLPPGHCLPMITVIASKNLTGLMPAVLWKGTYIAQVTLAPVVINSTPKKVNFASIFPIEWDYKK